MKRVALYTLGCKVNQVETEQIKEGFLGKGYEIVGFDDIADIYIINTCTVTHVSDRKSRAIIRRAARRNPDAIIVAIGCLAQVNSRQLADIEGINLIIGNREKENTVEIVQDYLSRLCDGTMIIDPPLTGEHRLRPILYREKHHRTRAFIKIQDGCENYCSYCIIPLARGPIRSKLPEDVVLEIAQLVDLGYKEIVLTGIHVGHYGIDLGINLLGLLKMICDTVSGDYRLRLGSIEPLEISNDLILFAGQHPEICRHFHIPLQSGSNKILKAMNRSYSRSYYRELLLKIARQIPGVALTTDVMVGFPGETDEDFLDTYTLIEEIPYQNLHVFKYSPRTGTPAAQMYPQVSEEEKQQRSDRLLLLARRKRQQFISALMGLELVVLVESRLENQHYTGLSDNYVAIGFNSTIDCTGEFRRLKVEKAEEQRVYGKLLNSIPVKN